MESASGNDQSNSSNINVLQDQCRIEVRVRSSVSLATIEKINKRTRRRLKPRTTCALYDNSWPGYGWLLPGWIAEERVMETGRIYRYYYDPEAKLYSSQQEVLTAWERTGLVVLDK